MEQCLKELPRVLKIGPYDWAVVKYDESGPEFTTCGQTDFETQEIILWTSMLPNTSTVVGTVLHECLHVIFENEKLGKLKKNKSAREEQIVLGFEAGLISLLRDNPKLLRWMLKWLK